MFRKYIPCLYNIAFLNTEFMAVSHLVIFISVPFNLPRSTGNDRGRRRHPRGEEFGGIATPDNVLGERQNLIYQCFSHVRLDGYVVFRQGCRTLQSSFVLLHFLGQNANAVGIVAVKALYVGMFLLMGRRPLSRCTVA